MISDTNSLHNYAVQELWRHLTGDLESKQPMIQVAMWALGEFADLLQTPITDNESNNSEQTEPLVVNEDTVIDKCEQILSSNLMTLVTKEYTIAALMKLSVRFPNTSARVKTIIDAFGCDHSVELQQRAAEFSALFSKYDHLRPSVLERMPPMAGRAEKRNGLQNGQATDEEINYDNNELSVVKNENKVNSQTSSSALLDLLDVSLSPNQIIDNMKPITISNSTANDVLDLLGGIDLNTSNNTQQQPIISSANSIFGNTLNESQTNNLFDGFLNDGTPNQQNSIPPIVAFDKNGLKLEFSFEKPSDNPILTIISLTAINSTSSPMLEFLFQAAVPKV